MNTRRFFAALAAGALLLPLPLALAPIAALAIQPTSGQPADEVMAQRSLPKMSDELWGKFLKCKLSYDEDKGEYGIQLTPEVKALGGKTITLHGFVLPLDGSDHTKHFLLSRNTPVCMYCPPGQPNEVVEVRTSHPIAWTEKVVAVTGKLDLIDDKEKAIFFRVQNAEAK